MIVPNDFKLRLCTQAAYEPLDVLFASRVNSKSSSARVLVVPVGKRGWE